MTAHSDASRTGLRPTRGLAIALSASLVVVWATIRLAIFETTVFPLTYVIPLLVCVWTRDRLALWSMVAAFAALHHAKMVWILPPDALAPDEWWANYIATFLNLLVGGAVIDSIIRVRDRLDTAIESLRDQAEELRVQAEELAQQNEELAEQSEELSRQTEELTQQREELANQNEELQSQAEEITTLNSTLGRREALLQTLLETERLSGTEEAAVQHIADAAMDLFGTTAAAVVVYETTGRGPELRVLAAAPATTGLAEGHGVEDTFVTLVLHGNRAASLNDTTLRPDLLVATALDRPIRSVLCAPVRLAGKSSAAFAIYSASAHEWTTEEFRLIDWLADQSCRVLQALRVQADLRDADRRKSEFLATLSHELRNPLTPITFALKLLESGNGHGDKQLRIMQRQVRQLVRLVDDLLDATRLTSNKIQIRRTRADLIPIVQHAVEAVRPDIEIAGHTITVRLPGEPVWLALDPDRIAQVVSNLLNNATRYTPSGGSLTVSVSADGSDAVLAVADTGIGLHPADLDRVFEMFTQVGGPGSGGLGIGLALVRGIVELHGGRVEAHSKGPGSGSEFRVRLPLEDAPATLSRVSDAGPARAGDTYRVLVVDDNRDSAEMMSELLALHGHVVRTEHDAESALLAAREFAPHTALLDIGLPGVDGYELARRLRDDERTKNIRLVAVTGWGQDADRARARHAGFDAHLTKPAEPDRVLAAIHAADGRVSPIESGAGGSPVSSSASP